MATHPGWVDASIPGWMPVRRAKDERGTQMERSRGEWALPVLQPTFRRGDADCLPAMLHFQLVEDVVDVVLNGAHLN